MQIQEEQPITLAQLTEERTGYFTKFSLAEEAMHKTVSAFAEDKQATDVTKASAVKSNAVKAAKMNARGKVVGISDKEIKIERTIKAG